MTLKASAFRARYAEVVIIRNDQGIERVQCSAVCLVYGDRNTVYTSLAGCASLQQGDFKKHVLSINHQSALSAKNKGKQVVVPQRSDVERSLVVPNHSLNDSPTVLELLQKLVVSVAD